MSAGPDIDRRRFMALSGMVAAGLVVPAARPAMVAVGDGMLRGVNLAGAEFGSAMPGVFGKDYIYPDAGSFQRFRQLGFDCIRLPFRWERIEPDVGGGLDGPEWQRLVGAVEAAERAGQTIILDLHNYARRKVRMDGFARDHMVGSSLVPASALARVWGQIAERVRGFDHVLLGIMNEPSDIEAARWLAIGNEVIAAIRATGSRHLILVPGVDWTGAHSWYASGNTVMADVVDPARNFAIEVHQYIDGDSSGRSGSAFSPTIGSERLEAFQEWARARGIKAFLGEFGGGSGASSIAALIDMVQEVEANRDVWIGWTAWAAGPWWPADEPLRLEPDAQGRLPPQTRAIARFASAGSVPSGQIDGSTIDLDFVRQRYHGAVHLDEALSFARGSPAVALQRNGQLKHFAAGALCITDFGMHVERARPSFQPPVVSASGALSSNAGVDAGFPVGVQTWSLAASGGKLALTGPTGGLAFHARWDPRAAGLLVISTEQREIVSIDLSRWRSRVIAEAISVRVSGSGEWRRIVIELTRPLRGVAVELKSEPGRTVLLGGFDTEPVLHPLPVARIADDVRFAGALARVVSGREFSLLIETRLHRVGGVMLEIGAKSAMRTREGGELEFSLVPRAVTSPASGDRWAQRMRCLVSISRNTDSVVLACTGSAPVTVRGGVPEFAGDYHLVGPLVTRVTAFDRALSGDEAMRVTG